MSKQLWNKGFEPDNRVEQYTVGSDRELDLRLARYDVQGSIAHVRMLATIGLITDEELNILVPALQDIAADIEAGRFTIDEGVEDVHSQVEFLLTERLGPVGKKIHAGRSRNDQVLVDLKLFFRDELLTLAGAVDRLFRLLLQLSERHADDLMPGYTHLQTAMPSSFGLWFGAYAETLADDMNLIIAAYRIANQNPLGSAAGYGSSFPLDRLAPWLRHPALQCCRRPDVARQDRARRCRRRFGSGLHAGPSGPRRVHVDVPQLRLRLVPRLAHHWLVNHAA